MWSLHLLARFDDAIAGAVADGGGWYCDVVGVDIVAVADNDLDKDFGAVVVAVVVVVAVILA